MRSLPFLRERLVAPHAVDRDAEHGASYSWNSAVSGCRAPSVAADGAPIGGIEREHHGPAAKVADKR